MEVENIKSQLRAYITERYAVAAEDAEFNDDVHLFEYGYIDSFGAVDLISFVEQKFGINITQADLVAYPLNSITEIATFTVLRRNGEL